MSRLKRHLMCMSKRSELATTEKYFSSKCHFYLIKLHNILNKSCKNSIFSLKVTSLPFSVTCELSQGLMNLST